MTCISSKQLLSNGGGGSWDGGHAGM